MSSAYYRRLHNFNSHSSRSTSAHSTNIISICVYIRLMEEQIHRLTDGY